MSNDKLSEAIEHYQRNLARGMRDGNNTKVMHCIFKLSNMPITTGHLEDTGIGRTVNAMRKMDGEIGDAARTLVSKWKQMVSQNQDCDESTENTSTESTSKSQSSSHSRSDKSRNTEKSHSPRSEVENSESEASSEENELHENEGKSSASDNKTSDSEAEEDDHFRDTSSKPKRSRHDSPPPRRKNDEKKASSKEKNGKRSRDEKDRRRDEDRRKKRDEDDDKKHEIRHEKHEKQHEKHEKQHEKHEKRRDKDGDRNGKSRSSEKDRKHGRSDEERSSKQSSSSSSKRKRDKSEECSNSDAKHRQDKDSSSKSSKHRSEDAKKSSSTDKTKHDSSKSTEKDSTKKKDSSKSSEKRKASEDKPPKSSSSSKLEVVEQGISSECGTSFADALGMLEPSTSKNVKRSKPDKIGVLEKTPEKERRPHRSEEREHRHDSDRKRSRESKEKPKEAEKSPMKPRLPEIIIPPPPITPLPKGDIDITSLLPAITPNYKPMPMFDFAQRAKVASDDYGALSIVMSQKNQRTKVYSGNKCGWGSVPTLFEMCIRILQDNIDALEYTGGVPYAILKPVLDKATPQQLYMMEHFNAYLIEDTDEIWKFHCQKEFKTKRREELESWRDMYMRCLDEREAKLKALTENIKQSQDKSTPVRQTKLAYMDSIVKPPRDIARKQAKNGVDLKRPLVTPQQRLNSIASGSSGAVSVPNPVRPISMGSSGIKPKKAPLMQKTLALLKGGRFRR